jgi:hypothetical protein
MPAHHNMNCAQVEAIVLSGNAQDALSKLFRKVPSQRDNDLNRNYIPGNSQQSPGTHQTALQPGTDGVIPPPAARIQQSSSHYPDICYQSPVTQLAHIRPSHSDANALLAALQERHLLQSNDAVPRCYTCGMSDHMSMECPDKNKNVRCPSL